MRNFVLLLILFPIQKDFGRTMRSSKPVIIVYMFWVGIVISQPNTCKKYGNCDPGPNCTDWSNSFKDEKCFKCCDDIGYITKDIMCNGIKDCESGSDEDPNFCYAKNLKYRTFSCNAEQQECSEDKDCISGICITGSCCYETCG